MILTNHDIQYLSSMISIEDLDSKVEIYEYVREKTGNFKNFSPQVAGDINIIKRIGMQAQKAYYYKSLYDRAIYFCNRATSFAKVHPQTSIFSSFAIGGGILAGFTTAPAWVGLVGGIALYASGRAIFSSCSHRTVAKKNRTDDR